MNDNVYMELFGVLPQDIYNSKQLDKVRALNTDVNNRNRKKSIIGITYERSKNAKVKQLNWTLTNAKSKM